MNICLQPTQIWFGTYSLLRDVTESAVSLNKYQGCNFCDLRFFGDKA